MLVGLEVPHVHVHLVPLDAMGDIQVVGLPQATPDALSAAAQRVRDALG